MRQKGIRVGRFAWTLLAGFALGTPAIPVGVSLSLPGPLALFAVLLGAMCCVIFAVFVMERVRLYWQAWRVRWKSAAVPAVSTKGANAAFAVDAVRDGTAADAASADAGGSSCFGGPACCPVPSGLAGSAGVCTSVSARDPG
ncbi:hypothetical protein, partial [Nocardia cyriacigeorgica]|uniref:hypothetical protein n=1 Tax=Nocardia cyriacigeorgica TaxID=135487 RepID=UPI0024565F88